ncbi:MAG TPA: double-strand break repair protein AddB [Pseudolabrys sp.]|nr:double-strand break repair protein AddB [Pseudolabrys sp.]
MPRVFTIPASVPFLPALVKALLDGRLVEGFPPARDPLLFASATIFLPTRRACRLARDAFLAETDGAILPRIVPIGDIDEDEIAFAQAATGELAAPALELPPALSGLERRLLLMQFVTQWALAPRVRGIAGAPLVAASPAAALGLADDLARLIDDMTTRQVSFDKLDTLVPDALDPYWQLTLEFLKIARDAWPQILQERGAIEAAARRDLLIAAEQQRLATSSAPVIAAGSTGSMPATAKLLAAIAALPHGAVVLPGLDTDLDDGAWKLLAGDDDAPAHDGGTPAAGHPQFAMHALLARMGIGRDAVMTLAPAAAHGRERIVSEALRPAITTQRWRALDTMAAAIDDATDSISAIDAGNAEEEALAIAVALRETLERPGKTAALVTPDRALARRVSAALRRWDVAFDDSGGDALADTPAGVFARLAAEAALEGLAPITLLALLKHPLFRLGGDEGHAAVATLERATLRGPRPRPGTKGLAHALSTFRTELAKFLRKEDSDLHWSDPRVRLSEAELDASASLINALAAALKPLESLPRKPCSLQELATLHRAVLAALGTNAAGDASPLNDRDDSAIDDALLELSSVATGVALAPSDYPQLFRSIIADRVVRRPEAHDVRIRIFGPLESRLQSVDRVVLGGMIEGTWPPETRTDPWLSRPMRHQLGLDLPERRIGLSAHDFAQALGAPEIVISRAAKIGGAPTVPSRFVQRLAAVAGEARWDAIRARGERYIHWARTLDAPADGARPMPRPEPKPPRGARPNMLSVTEIEHWLRDPYTIYAKHVLKITPLDAVDTPPGAADRGTVIHAAMKEFTQRYAAALPADPAAELIALGRKHFAPLTDYPEALAFWWPRFVRIANWFGSWDVGRRAALAQLLAEAPGHIEIPLGERNFRLTTRADRIERLPDGRYAILDYKTGRLPSAKEVKVGFAPQLTLEAAILRAGGFEGIASGASVDSLVYVGLRGGEPPGEQRLVELKDSTPDIEADRALAKLTKVAARFENEDEPYRSLLHPMWKTRYGDYDHLARVKEWSLIGGEEEEW